MIQVTCALIFQDNKVLITQNGEDSDHPFQWEFPGGKVKSGESPQECIIREIKEELELGIKVMNTLQPVEYDYKIKEIRLTPFVCSIIEGELKLNEHADGKWVDFDELTKFDLAAADKKLVEFNYDYLRDCLDFIY
ncbi:MAG: (deoxy)nucleoside triphosphate pyrophosphohydrolase [Bacteroidota bacterium]